MASWISTTTCWRTSSDSLGPAHLEGNQPFEETLKRRAAARNAITAAEVDRKLRRALLRKYQRQQGPLTLGQSCFYWRDSRASDLKKIRWHGPARVVMVEHDEQGRPRLYCTPHPAHSSSTTSCSAWLHWFAGRDRWTSSCTTWHRWPQIQRSHPIPGPWKTEPPEHRWWWRGHARWCSWRWWRWWRWRPSRTSINSTPHWRSSWCGLGLATGWSTGFGLSAGSWAHCWPTWLGLGLAVSWGTQCELLTINCPRRSWRTSDWPWTSRCRWFSKPCGLRWAWTWATSSWNTSGAHQSTINGSWTCCTWASSSATTWTFLNQCHLHQLLPTWTSMSLLALKRSFDIDVSWWIEPRPQSLVLCGNIVNDNPSPTTRTRTIRKIEIEMSLNTTCSPLTSLTWILHRSLMAGRLMMMATSAWRMTPWTTGKSKLAVSFDTTYGHAAAFSRSRRSLMCRSLPTFWTPTALRLQKLLMETAGHQRPWCWAAVLGLWMDRLHHLPDLWQSSPWNGYVCQPAFQTFGQGHKDQDGQTAQEGCQQFHQRKTAFSWWSCKVSGGEKQRASVVFREPGLGVWHSGKRSARANFDSTCLDQMVKEPWRESKSKSQVDSPWLLGCGCLGQRIANQQSNNFQNLSKLPDEPDGTARLVCLDSRCGNCFSSRTSTRTKVVGEIATWVPETFGSSRHMPNAAVETGVWPVIRCTEKMVSRSH